MTQQMTKWTRKQAGCIYRAMKEGRVEMARESVAEMYDLVNDGGAVDYNGSANGAIQSLKFAVDAIFAGDYEAAQAHLDRFAGVGAEPEPEDDEDAETYTTGAGVTFVYWEQGDGFAFYEKGDPASEDFADWADNEFQLCEHFERMTAWMAA